MYTSSISNLNYVADEVLAAADMYQIYDLKYICEQFIMENLENDDVINAITFSDVYDSTRFKEQCLKMKEN